MSNRFNVLDTESLQGGLDEEQQAEWDNHNNLIHQVFEQNPQGKKLLELWRDTLISIPTVTPNSTQFEAGIAEGKKTVVREIILAIKNVEGQ